MTEKTTYIPRAIEPSLLNDLRRKMVFIGGARQSGKTTLARHVAASTGRQPVTYLNWDVAADRHTIIHESFPAGPGVLILDEIHKFRRWRQVVKGLFDSRGHEVSIIVTGSARLDYYRRGGDSLQGRYNYHRLFPLALPEIGSTRPHLEDLLRYGGFPEPFLLKSDRESARWSREYQSRVIDSDLRDLERVMDLSLVQLLADRLPSLIGSPLSVNALREDLQVSHQTVSRWVQLLENIYLLFRIYPFGAPAIKAVKKEPKLYFFDWIPVKDPGPRFENLVACQLYGWCCRKQDEEGGSYTLHYFRTVDKKEVDFVVCNNRQPVQFVECKLGPSTVDDGLRYLKKKYPAVAAAQIICTGDDDYITKDGIRVCGAARFLKDW